MSVGKLKHFLLGTFLAIFLIPSTVSAQVSLTATLGTSTGTFTTLNAAFTAINNGTHKGVIAISITANTSEPSTPVPLLKSGTGSSSYTSISITTTGADTIFSASSPAANRGIIELAGADNVTIDGDDPGTAGIQRALVIQSATSSSSGIACIRLSSNSTSGTDGADNITVKNCVLIGAKNSSTTTTISYGIQFSNGTSTSSSSTGAYNSQNTLLQNNEIYRCSYGINARGGSSTNGLPYTIIKDNIIGNANTSYNVTQYGIYLYYTSNTVSKGILIQGNDIQVGEATTGINTNIYGLYISSYNYGLHIQGNNIHNVANPSSGGWGAHGISLYSSLNDSVKITNNFIRDITTTNYSSSLTSTYQNYGIFISSVGNGLEIIHNTIYLNALNATNSFGSNENSSCVVFTSASYKVSKFLNNILINNQGSVSSNAHCIITMGTGNISAADMDNNDYYVATGGTIGYYNSTPCVSLTSWQSATGKDGASWNVAPPFTSSTNLHIPNSSATPLESGGAPTTRTGVTTDIDNTVRPGAATNGYGTAPDIGADEFDGINPAPSVDSLTITPLGQCSAVAHTVTAKVKPGPSTLSSVKIYYSINGGTPTAVTMTGGSLSSLSTWTGTIPAASPVNGVVTWNVTATDGTFSKVKVGTGYQDAPLYGLTVIASTTKAAFCLGDSTMLNGAPGPTSTSDDYDYTSIPFDTAATPATGVTTLASGGSAITSLTSGTLDDGYWTITLPFSVKFYGANYSSASIGTNGVIMFGTTTTTGYSSSWPSTSNPLGAFGVVYGDQNLNNTGTVEYFVTGNAPNRVLVINWKGTDWYYSTPSATYQAKLYESTGVLEAHITECTSGNNHKLGLNNPTGTAAVQPSGRTAGYWAVSTPEAWRFAPQIAPNATYLWTPNGPGSGIAAGDETKLNIKAKPTSTTNYVLTVSNPTTCSFADTVTVVVNQPPTILINPTPAKVCIGSSLQLVASGGATYSWSPSATLNTATGNTVTATPTLTTTYTINSTTSAGCSGDTTLVVTVNPLPTVSIAPAGPTTFCIGGSVALSGTGASTYAWAPSSGLSAATGTTVSASPGITTSYTVTGTDSNGCVDTGMQIVTINQQPIITFTPASAIICQNDSISITAAGATSYLWSPGSSLDTTAGATVLASPAATQTYSIIGTDANGCKDTVSKTVTVNGAPVFTVTPSGISTICSGTLLGLKAAGTVTYSWSPASGLSATTGDSVTASPTSTTTYTITGSDAIGCTAKITKTINVNTSPIVSISNGSTTTFCIGDSVKMTGSGAPTLAWSPAAGLNSTTASVVTAKPSTTTTYVLTGTAANGCTDTAQMKVTVNQLPIITVSPAGGQSICIGKSIMLTATGASAYSWSPSSSLAPSTGSVVNATPASTITYTVTGTDVNGCVNTATKVVTVNPRPTVVVSPSTTPVICEGKSTPLSASGAVSYAWSPSSSLSSGTGASVSASPTTTTTYTIIGTNSFGCTDTATKQVKVNPLPTITISPATASFICSGSGVVLTASGASTYLWTPSTGLSSTNTASTTAKPTASRTYTVTGTDANGCVDTAKKLVTVNNLPNVMIAPFSPITSCEGIPVNLMAIGAATYSWSPATGLDSPSNKIVTATPSSTTTYTVTGTDSNGCVNTATKTVKILPAPNTMITPSGYKNICQDDTVYFTAVPGYKVYNWQFYGVTVRSDSNNVLKTFMGGYYTLTITDDSGCQASSTAPTIVTVTPHPLPVIKMVGGSMDAGGPYASYQWYKGSTAVGGATSKTYAPGASGYYRVAVTDTSAIHCAGISEPFFYTALSVGSTSLAGAISLYPNPSTDKVYIQSPIPVTITVLTMEGKQIVRLQNAKEFSLGSFADGLYQVDIRDANGQWIKTEKVNKLSR